MRFCPLTFFLFCICIGRQTPDAHDALVEIVGTLALLTFADVSYADLIAQHGLVEFCVKHLMPGFAEDDIGALEVHS